MAEPANAEGLPAYDCSLWRAFDEMQLCYMIAGQARHYYRYGELRDCSVARQKLLFCASLLTKSPEKRESLLADRARDAYQRKVDERPSRAVWTLRTKPPRDFPPNDST